MMLYGEGMASDFPDVTPFSVAFGSALKTVMDRRGVSQSAVARAIGKKAGASYVSERVNGKRAVDTDVIAGVAEVANVPVSTIVREVLAEMKRQQGGEGATVTPIKPKPAPDPVAPTVQTRAARKRQGKPKMGDE
jgi:transcriptional regulator with XRE-family HTH domain